MASLVAGDKIKKAFHGKRYLLGEVPIIVFSTLGHQLHSRSNT
jgi:hypothetical protein